MDIISFRMMLALVLVLGTGHSLAQDTDEEMEATMRLMGNAEAELPHAVIKEIKLPDSLLERNPESPAVDAVDASEDGHTNANENRERREAGLTNADGAREHGAEMSEQATEDRENRGRSEDPPGPPDNPGPPQ